jgi:hypothetical protein
MVYRGHVRNGKVELDGDVRLPDGQPVDVSLVPEVVPEPHDDGEGPTLYERLKPIIGAAKGLPPDASRNVDHYLYGQPRR